MTRPVVITGLGPITAYGVGIEPLFQAMLVGESAIGRIQYFNPDKFPCQISAELSADKFNVRKVVPKSYRKATKVMCRDIELAVGAAAAAVDDAGWTTPAIDPNADPTYPPQRVGCHIGAGLIAAEVNELTAALVTSKDDAGNFDLEAWGESGMNNLTPLWLLKYLPNMLACHVTIIHNCQGPSNTITCCEASSGLSLIESVHVIQRGAADACLSGGAEFKLNTLSFIRQFFAQRLAETNGKPDPTSVVRPFDSSAIGTVLGEGGGILAIEAEDSARARGVTPYARIVGWGATQSFCPDTVGLELNERDPDPANAVRHALRIAELSTDDIDAIVPLGSSIPTVDRTEAFAIHEVFEKRASSIPLITTIPFAGHCGAGNGAVGLCVAAQCLKTQQLPARLNTQGVDDLDANACPARDAELSNILVMCPSQGGQNTAVILQRL